MSSQKIVDDGCWVKTGKSEYSHACGQQVKKIGKLWVIDGKYKFSTLARAKSAVERVA